MQHVAWLAMMMVFAAGPGAQAPRRPQTGPVSFAIFVSDASGTPLGGVTVTVDGPAKRQVTTEAGRIALEDLPTGPYHFTFEREGFYRAEKDVTAKGRAPIDVKITMTARPKPVGALPPPAPEPTGQPTSNPVVLDLPSVIEKNYVGRAAGKTLSLACSTGGASTLIQINQPLPEHAHADADEFIYVIAGDGTAHVGGRDERLHPGFLLVVPRQTPHSFTVSGRSPLVMLSMRAGEKCAS